MKEAVTHYCGSAAASPPIMRQRQRNLRISDTRFPMDELYVSADLIVGVVIVLGLIQDRMRYMSTEIEARILNVSEAK